jgi:hypothetical protein
MTVMSEISSAGQVQFSMEQGRGIKGFAQSDHRTAFAEVIFATLAHPRGFGT